MSKCVPFSRLSCSAPIPLGVFALLHACSADVTETTLQRPPKQDVEQRPLTPSDDSREPESGSTSGKTGVNEAPVKPGDVGAGASDGRFDPLEPPGVLPPRVPGPASPDVTGDAGPSGGPEPPWVNDSSTSPFDAGPATDSGSLQPSIEAGAAPVVDPPAARAPLLDVSVGAAHACVLLAAGRVRCWGEREDGKLGYPSSDEEDRYLGDDEPPSSAGDVQLGEPAFAIAAGARNTCAILAQGRVRCWGDARDGRLGDGNGGRDEDDIGDDEAPAIAADVPLGEPAVQVVVGGGISCALLASGSVRCWGLAAAGKLGAPGVVFALGDDETPLAVAPVDLGERATSIAAGANHACAILESGAVRCWGRNSAGQLGYGHREIIGDDESPSTQPPLVLGGRAIQLALGNVHSCALLADRTLRCWGNDLASQLGGEGSFLEGELPNARPPLDLGQPVLQVTAGSTHSCALLADQTLRCWGANGRGQLGAKSGEPELGLGEIPPYIDLGAEALRVDAGSDSTCAVLSTGQLSCWGEGGTGQLGLGRVTPLADSGRFIIGDDETPAVAGPVLLF